MFASLGHKGGRRKLRVADGLLQTKRGVIRNSAGYLPGDLRVSFDETAPHPLCVELDGTTITGGKHDNPEVAKRYPWMVSGDDIVLPDGRGEFLRIWDHGAGVAPDAGSRGARAGDGQTGDYPGTTEGHAIKSHRHVQTYGEAFNNLDGGAADRPRNTNGYTGYRGGNENRGKNLGVSLWMVMG